MVDAQGRLYAWTLLERDSVSGEFLTAGYLQLDSTGAARDTVVFPKLAPEPPQLKAQTPDGGASTIWGLPWAGGNGLPTRSPRVDLIWRSGKKL